MYDFFSILLFEYGGFSCVCVCSISSHSFFFFFLISTELVYNVVLASVTQQNNSVVCRYRY